MKPVDIAHFHPLLYENQKWFSSWKRISSLPRTENHFSISIITSFDNASEGFPVSVIQLADQKRQAVVLPSETQSREFDPKLLLACILAERGIRTIVGSRIAIHNKIHLLSPRLYIAKDFRRPSNRIFRILRGLGADIVAWDEEGVLMFSRELYYSRRIHAETFAGVSQFFAWGPVNAEMIRSFPDFKGQPVHLVGNPRLDMLRPEVRPVFDHEVALLRKAYGKFILINTNFGKLNHHLDSYVVRPGGKDKSVGGAITPEMNEAWAHQSEVFEAFKRMIGPLAERFPGNKIVIRPHPSESLETWRKIASANSDVVVLHEGPVQPWLLAAEVLIHSSCTTGIEAYLMDRKVISYRPVCSEKFDHKVSNDLSVQARSEAELFDKVERALNGKWLVEDAEGKFRAASNLFSSLRGPLAGDRIADVIETATKAPAPNEPTIVQRTLAAAHSAARSAFRNITSRIEGHKHSTSYSLKRFPGVTELQVNNRINDFSNILDRFDGVSARELYRDVFLISKNG